MPTIKDIAPESVFTIELNAGTPGIQGPQGPQGVQGPVGPRGETGPKPIRGIDYFTQQDINNMVSTVTSSSNSAFNENVANRTTEFNSNVSIKTTAFDNNATLKTEEFDNNANSKKTDFNLNANNRTTEFNTNASNKKNEIDTHVTNKTTEFDNHVAKKINEFKEETSEYVTENELENKGYLVESDLDGYAKEKDLFSGSYNDLKDKPKIPSKTSELTNDKGFINAIPSEYVTEEEQNEFIKPYSKRIEENEKYISDLEATIDILTNTNKAKGELVHITDALNLPTFENKVDGNVEQETTKGNQLFDISTVRNVGITPETGATWANEWWRLSDYIKIEENTPFTFSWVSDSAFFQVQGCYYDENKTYISGFNMSKDGVYSRTETTPIGTKYLRIAYSINVSGNLVTREDIMLNLGTTALPWEKFTNGASPNPSYPQEIEVLEGDLSYKVNGKNFLYNHREDVVTINGITFTKNKDGSLTINGTATSISQYNLCQIGELYLKPNTYVFSSGNNIPTSMWFSFRENNKDMLTLTKVNSGTFTLTENSKNASVYIYINKGVTINNLTIYPMISLEGGEYEPYQEQIVPLDLKGNWVGAINDNIKDYLVTDKKKYWLVKNVGKFVLDGSEKYIDVSIRTNTIRVAIALQGVSYSAITSHLIIKYHVYNSDIEGQLLENNYLVLSFPIDIVGNTIASLRTWLSNNNLTGYYQLAEPYTEELGELPEPIKTFEGINNIQVLANLDTEIEVKYALDVKKYFENKLAEISAQII